MGPENLGNINENINNDEIHKIKAIKTPPVQIEISQWEDSLEH